MIIDPWWSSRPIILSVYLYTGCRQYNSHQHSSSGLFLICEKTTYFQSSSECGKCDRECIGCHGRLSTQCHRCRNYNQTDAKGFECVRNCSKGFYEAEGKQCLPCHLDCSVCHGSGNHECSECKFVRIYRELPPPRSTGKDFKDAIHPV